MQFLNCWQFSQFSGQPAATLATLRFNRFPVMTPPKNPRGMERDKKHLPNELEIFEEFESRDGYFGTSMLEKQRIFSYLAIFWTSQVKQGCVFFRWNQPLSVEVRWGNLRRSGYLIVGVFFSDAWHSNEKAACLKGGTSSNGGFPISMLVDRSVIVYWKIQSKLHPRSLPVHPWKMVVGRLLSFWDGIFSQAMLNFRCVFLGKLEYNSCTWIFTSILGKIPNDSKPTFGVTNRRLKSRDETCPSHTVELFWLNFNKSSIWKNHGSGTSLCYCTGKWKERKSCRSSVFQLWSIGFEQESTAQRSEWRYLIQTPKSHMF